MKKELTLEQRQCRDLLFWMGILLSGGLCFAFYTINYPIILPVIPLLLSFYLMYKNNKIALKQLKEEKKCHQ